MQLQKMTFGVRIIVFGYKTHDWAAGPYTCRAQDQFKLASPPITSHAQTDAHLQYPRTQHSGSENGNDKLNDGLGCCLIWLCGNTSWSADAPPVRPLTVIYLPTPAEILCLLRFSVHVYVFLSSSGAGMIPLPRFQVCNIPPSRFFSKSSNMLLARLFALALLAQKRFCINRPQILL